jgi:hypothetical protein
VVGATGVKSIEEISRSVNIFSRAFSTIASTTASVA